MSDDNPNPMTDEPARSKPLRVRNKPVYDQVFFLDLARPKPGETHEQVRERWNAWRREPASEGRRVTFEGVDFRTEENRGISFAGFEFGDWARFDAATFGAGARFDGATFGDGAGFDGATFGREGRFEDAVFGANARFEGVTFGSLAWFAGATFGEWASFAGASFGEWASFIGRKGERDVEARQRSWTKLEVSERVTRLTAYRERREARGFGPGKFSAISFDSARFRGVASFALRSFEGPTDFTGARFDLPPDFDGATNLQRIDFTGARAGFGPADRPWWKPDWTTDSAVAIRLRALRSQIEATKNHDFERDLYIEERKAERGIHLDRLWRDLRPERAVAVARATLGTLPRLPKVDVFAGKDEPMVTWPAAIPNRRAAFRPAFVDGRSPAALRLRRGRLRHAARFLGALGRLLGHLLWIAVMAFYWACADYGRSCLRPFAWLIVVLGLFYGVGPVDGLDARALSDLRTAFVARAEVARPGHGVVVAARYDAAVGLYAVANSIPFVGPLTVDAEVKRFLFCGEAGKGAGKGSGTGVEDEVCVALPPRGFQFATIAQNLFSILMVFFIGLALRNYFRLK